MGNFDKDIAHIVYASDDRFAEILAVSLVSLYENSRDMEEIIVYVLDSGILPENRKKIDSISRDYGRSVPVWIMAKNISNELRMEVSTDRGSLSQYARLFLSSTLPGNLERVLYLDCDTLICRSIRELWNLEMHGRTVAALMDAFSKYYRKNIGLRPDDVMFNSGVMLVDLTRWKEQHVEKRLLEFISRKNGRIQQGDQGALNAILSHDTYCFEPRFNSVTIFYDFNFEEMMAYRRPPRFYSEEEVRKAVEEPNIVHFTSSFLSKRPWVKGCRHRYMEEWMKYRQMTAWKDEELREENICEWKKVITKILMKLPSNIMLRIVSIPQIYLRPFWFKVLNMMYF
ncbi:MAG: glycosyltransferase family 8 protein [Lachnoclostridium sp.]|nr:glycosyltransferase family 8 protein [Lachnospira sp.]MCM1248464.1 glycosyltransferase family 8 protein [Lachnoclostridium sp.]